MAGNNTQIIVKKAGRPRVDIDDYFTKIQPFLQLGYKLYKACLYAGVPYMTVLDYYNAHDDFREIVERERLLVNTIARKNLVQAIKGGDLETSKDWLETQEKEDFTKRQEVVDATPQDEGIMLLREIIIQRRRNAKKLKGLQDLTHSLTSIPGGVDNFTPQYVVVLFDRHSNRGHAG